MAVPSQEIAAQRASAGHYGSCFPTIYSARDQDTVNNDKTTILYFTNKDNSDSLICVFFACPVTKEV